MAEQQYPIIEDNEFFDAVDDTVKSVAIRKIDSGDASFSKASNQDSASTSAIPQIDSSLAEAARLDDERENVLQTVKMPALKIGQVPPLTEPIQEPPQELQTPQIAEIQDVATTIEHGENELLPAQTLSIDYDFSEVDIDFMDIISDSLVTRNVLSEAYAEVPTADAINVGPTTEGVDSGDATDVENVVSTMNNGTVSVVVESESTESTHDEQDEQVEDIEPVVVEKKRVTLPLSEEEQEVAEVQPVQAAPLAVTQDIHTDETPMTEEAVTLIVDDAMEHLEEAVDVPETPAVEHIEDEQAEAPVFEEIELPVTPPIEDSHIPATPLEAETRQYSAKMYAYVHRGQKRRRLSWRRVLASLFSLVLIANLLFLWRDLQATHVYLTTLNASNGAIRAQQDVGSYQDISTLTAPVYSSSSVFIGVHGNKGQQATQEIQAFTRNDTNWKATTQFTAPLIDGALQVAPDGQLVTSSSDTTQVRTAAGRLLWQTYNTEPTRGTHHFQPASDGRTLYTIKSVKQSQIAAYDLRTGQQQWVQTLDDGIDYAPPFLLDGTILYAASNHNIYALKSSDGSLLWQRPYPTRTLLITQQGQARLLLSIGTRGVVALNTTTGQQVWAFTGQVSDTLTATEFYQAGIGTVPTADGTLVYATGIAWLLPQVQQQVWLYAVNARTGMPVWSQQVGAGLSSADAGRIFSPLVASTHGLVIFQMQVSTNRQRIIAFDAIKGIPRWSRDVENTTATASTLLQMPDNNLLFFSTSVSGIAQLHTLSLPRLLLLLGIVGSMIGLLAILVFPVSITFARFSALLSLSRGIFQRAKTLERYSLRVMVLILLLPIVLAGVLDYFAMNRPQENVYQLVAHTGSTQWQSVTDQAIKPLFTDAQESIVTVNRADNQRQLQVLSSTGAVNWQTFPSEGTFMVPIASPHPGTVLIALSGRGPRNYQFAPDDPAYLHSIDNFLMLYLFEQSTGRVLWQHIAVYPGEQQQGVVLGADANDIYIAGTQKTLSTDGTGQTLQLFAVNQQSGVVDWRIFGPTEASNTPHDNGTLLLRQGLAVWQVAGIVYGIDTGVGQIAWRHPLVQDDPALLIQEEQHMVALSGTLLITRLDGVHALDLATGTELWQLPQLNTTPIHSATGVEVVGHMLLVYGNGQLVAFDAQSHQSLWQQKQLDNIQHVGISDDGKYIYVSLFNSVEATTPEPSIVALDVQTGTIHWTFSPQGQIFKSNDYANGFLYSHGELFVTVCAKRSTSPCTDQRLYALNGATGQIDWKIDSSFISDIRVSQDGTRVLFSASSSPWQEMLGQIKG